MADVTLAFAYINLGSGINNPTPGRAIESILSARHTGLKPHLGGFVESHKFMDKVERMSFQNGYKAFRAPRPEGVQEKRGAWDPVSVTRKSMPDQGSIWIRAHGSSRPLTIAPPRYFVISMSRVGGKDIAMFIVHTNAAIRGLDANKVDRVKKTGEYWDQVNAQMTALQAAGYKVFLLGDINLHEGDSYQNATTPWQVFRRRDLKYRTTGLDCFACPVGFDIGQFKVIPGKPLGTDHDGIAVKGKL
jgi:hypothetical protein